MSESIRTQPPEPGAIRPVSFPRIERDRLDNGLDILSARHGDLPLVTGMLVLDAGAEHEPDGAGGVARLAVRALETGTASRSADDIAWELERLGVELETSASWDGTRVRFTVPRERLEPAISLVADIVRRPAFPEGEVERLRQEQLATILQRRSEPGSLASDMAVRFIFAPDVPYARPRIGTKETVERLRREDAAAFYRAHYMPSGGALLLVGDIDAETAATLAGRHFGDWSRGEPAEARFDVSPAVDATTVFVVDRPGAVQSEVRIGHVGVPRRHDDYFPLVVMNTLLGGAFTSRLNMNLRERHGFTYGVRSGFGFRHRPGPFLVQTAVATDVTAPAVREILHELRHLRDDGASDDEVSSARDYLRGVLPLRLQTTDQLAGRMADLVTYELPDDYLQRYRGHVADVATADADRVAREHLHADRLAIVVVGDADAVAPELEALDIGPVDVHAAGNGR